jgi:hypothetical protein
MSAAAVNHFVDEATDNGVDPFTAPRFSSWMTSPFLTTRRTPPLRPAAAIRWRSAVSAASNAPTRSVEDVVVGSAVEELGESSDEADISPDPL